MSISDSPFRFNNANVVRNEELEQWITGHHVGDDVFVHQEAANSWDFAFGPFTIQTVIDDLSGGKYKGTGVLYFRQLGVSIKICTFSSDIDTSKGDTSSFGEVNMAGIAKGKIGILFEGKTFYQYAKLDAFGKLREFKWKLFSI